MKLVEPGTSSDKKGRRVALSLALLAVCAAVSFQTPSFSQAQNTDPSQKQEKEPFKADSAPPDVVVDERTEMEMLRDLGDSLKRLDHAATETVKEVNRHAQGGAVTSQDVLDAVVMDPFATINATAPWDPTLTASLRNGPVLPPRKKWLDFDVNEVGSVVGILQHEISALCPPVALSTSAKDSFKMEVGLMTEANNKIQTSNDALKTLTQGPNYDNDKIGKTAHDIRLACQTIEACRKRAAKALSQ